MPSRNAPDEQDLAQAIVAVEESLTALKERYQQVKKDQRRQEQLKALEQELKQQAKANHSEATIRAELQHIQQEITNIELNLESRLWNWKELREPFWQAVRFSGLGIVIGWLLKSCSN
ncbi:hypothetical protein [Gloeocapsa sp. PCC 73106]|uniref:hypothetical protein n=1 Tax=Gloeocapsa sp. PCC 73106 TaxID=102232 RepID=UPI0002AC4CDF|nr:hypothetical protein [Gloeocapsa sp. PCC 73106]ELR98235.1 hypothetical protein GLO73106DRAFT_00020620 [Gloeocapsa sp. PCC 73106]